MVGFSIFGDESNSAVGKGNSKVVYDDLTIFTHTSKLQ